MINNIFLRNIIMKKIVYKEIKFIDNSDDNDKKIDDGYQTLTKKINEWYKDNQNIDIVSIKFYHTQIIPRILGIRYTAEICYIEKYNPDAK